MLLNRILLNRSMSFTPQNCIITKVLILQTVVINGQLVVFYTKAKGTFSWKR